MEGKPKAGALRAFVHGLRIDAHAIWLAVRDPRTPVMLRIFGTLVAAYALSPIDLIPDFVPVLGFLDDAIILPVGIWLFVRMIPRPLWEEFRARAAAEARRPVSMMGAAMVIAVWIAIAMLILFMLSNWRYY